MTSFPERIFWNTLSYGSATRLPAGALRLAFVVLCVVTPFTNWMIPFAGRIFPGDLVLRY